MLPISPAEFAVLALAALLVGGSKTALPALASLPVALFAAVLPAKASTGVLLVLLLVGDVVAVYVYRSFTDWATLRQLVPSVLGGVVLGTAFLAVANNDLIRVLIGVILVALVIINAVVQFRDRRTELPAAGDVEVRGHRARAIAYGSLGGFTTMVANAGGPVMSIYFLASRFSVSGFLGTAAWFFLTVNLIKLPFSIGLGLVTAPGLLSDLALAPFVLLGAFIGRILISRVSQRWFGSLVLLLTLASGLYLIFSALMLEGTD